MNLGYVVLYLKDTKKAKDFWVQKIGFVMKKEVNMEGQTIYTVGKKGDNTNLELVPLKLMENNPYELNLGLPSICFKTNDLNEMHLKLKQEGVKVTDIQEHNGMKVFTFFDEEDNAFALSDNK